MIQFYFMIHPGSNFKTSSILNHKDLRKEDFEFISSIDTRWRDMDAIQHVNNATILSYYETVRVEFLGRLGFSLVRRQSNGVILASMQIDYFSQLSHPSKIYVGCRITRIGTKSFDLCSALFSEVSEHPISAGKFVLVTFDYINQKTIPISKSIKDSYLPFID